MLCQFCCALRVCVSVCVYVSVCVCVCFCVCVCVVHGYRVYVWVSMYACTGARRSGGQRQRWGGGEKCRVPSPYGVYVCVCVRVRACPRGARVFLHVCIRAGHVYIQQIFYTFSSPYKHSVARYTFFFLLPNTHVYKSWYMDRFTFIGTWIYEYKVSRFRLQKGTSEMSGSCHTYEWVSFIRVKYSRRTYE